MKNLICIVLYSINFLYSIDFNYEILKQSKLSYREINIINTITTRVLGCTDPTALNFNPDATEDDGSCVYGLLGDVNIDSEVNVVDVVLLVNIILEFNDYSLEQLVLGDFNQDGILNVIDVVQIVNFILIPEPDDPFEWVNIPAGEFTYGASNSIINIDYDYKIMKYNVTNEQFVTWFNNEFDAMQCYVDSIEQAYIQCWFEGFDVVTEGFYTFVIIDPNPEVIEYNNIGVFHWDGDGIFVDPEFNNHPVTLLNIATMITFANYYNAVFPSQLEWEKAARGQTGFIYPFGNEISAENVNALDSGDPWEIGTSPVGYYNGNNGTINSVSNFGLYDMSGNISDITRDYSNLTSSTLIFFLRGGDYLDDLYSNQLQSYYWNTIAIWFSNYNSLQMGTGFRLLKYE